MHRIRNITERVYIVGRGESLQYLTREHFGEGVVITINRAILKVNCLGLPNRIFAMQKDGNKAGLLPCNNECYRCNRNAVDPGPAQMIINWQSINCFPDLDRIFVDESLGKSQHPSAVVAVWLAKYMGAKEIILLCFDSITGNIKAFDPLNGKIEQFEPYRRGMTMTLEALGNIQHKFITPCLIS